MKLDLVNKKDYVTLDINYNIMWGYLVGQKMNLILKAQNKRIYDRSWFAIKVFYIRCGWSFPSKIFQVTKVCDFSWISRERISLNLRNWNHFNKGSIDNRAENCFRSIAICHQKFDNIMIQVVVQLYIKFSNFPYVRIVVMWLFTYFVMHIDITHLKQGNPNNI